MRTPETLKIRDAWDRIAVGYDKYVTPTPTTGLCLKPLLKWQDSNRACDSWIWLPAAVH